MSSSDVMAALMTEAEERGALEAMDWVVSEIRITGDHPGAAEILLAMREEQAGRLERATQRVADLATPRTKQTGG